MQNHDLELLRYPIGKFEYGQPYSMETIKEQLASIAILPHNLTELVGKWGDERLDTPYRPGGWTVRQVVHHLVDSHMNAYIRTKLAVTEENPQVKGYDEAAWAELPDYRLSIAPSLVILSNLHQRWVTVLDKLTDEQFRRTYYHPGYQRTYVLAEVAGLYAWHGEHHYQHVRKLAERNNWLRSVV
ncbi:YfiT family bacillithiol transferase [Tellurirhabdus rosea]|uniref:YfiT family bacillithiol transferase n=1 Tax=Tellurirhabdus rosea TaxID=2674997 RepID=UPI00225698E8|nr:putative metal-dependent hydrolase [Tellurirhabdus rosea]